MILMTMRFITKNRALLINQKIIRLINLKVVYEKVKMTINNYFQIIFRHLTEKKKLNHLHRIYNNKKF